MTQSHEEEPTTKITDKAGTGPRLSFSHELARRTADPEPTATNRTLATHPLLDDLQRSATRTRLKLTQVFRCIYRRGRWAHSPVISVGILPNQLGYTRIGLRTERGMKGAVERNRLKRQVRTVVFDEGLPVRCGVDLVFVIRQRAKEAGQAVLSREISATCRKAGALE